MGAAAETEELSRRPNNSPTAEQRLLQAVLHRGIFDALGEFGTTMHSPDLRRATQARALNWIRGEQIYCCPSRGVSFGFVCETLGIDPALVRHTVKTLLVNRKAKRPGRKAESL